MIFQDLTPNLLLVTPNLLLEKAITINLGKAFVYQQTL
jgi:hypothetical protein